MDVNGGRFHGFMAEDSLDGKQVCAVFVKMGAQGMAEGVAGEASWPAEPVFVFVDVPGEEKGVDGPVRIGLFWEKPSHRSSAFKPVCGKGIKGVL